MNLRRTTLCALLLAVPALCARTAAAEDPVLPASIIFATSTGYWEDDGTTPGVQRAPSAAQTATPAAAPAKPRHGYYKLFAVRQADRTAKIYLQQIEQGDGGPAIASTVELQELNDLRPYVTDIRPENSSGMLKEPGLFAMIYLKTDPDVESETWTVVIDEFGEVTVGKASN
ncbi:hypothetical protein J2W42_001387 [Rhizobium tibeticum]|uniref:Uncharacterized protein n=1 Tax=Rhizobium tibeticum TaxID=501024 RepID=A0A1H8GMV4_9HYPH|nr:hypothetical protein [Rhizobium tibeticum]MDP9808545.1 hypothetical protein [Rhizobium tibeticum]SEH62882.1 hypothetical protein RTCCBAU85039_1501 [Rhizobium tibeticum]SEN45481.1 hypothetical protein SAMN05216228_1004311 [Rhizobium tibeticum]